MGCCGPEIKYLLQENGDRIELENGKGFLLLEDQDIGSTSSPWKSAPAAFVLFVVMNVLQQIMDGI